MVLIIAIIAWFAWYPILTKIKWGRLSSISASSYKWKGNAKAWFIAWLVGLGVLSVLLANADHDMALWYGFMGVGFCIAGMSPDHKQDPKSVEDAFHTVGTILGIAAPTVGMSFVYGFWWLPIVGLAVTGLLYVMTKKYCIWYTELWWATLISGHLLAI